VVEVVEVAFVLGVDAAEPQLVKKLNREEFTESGYQILAEIS
jgi:hypothetical protein